MSNSRRFRRHLGRAAMLATAGMPTVSGLVIDQPSAAYAYAQEVNGCNDSTIDYSFGAFNSWALDWNSPFADSGARRTDVENSFNQLRGHKGWSSSADIVELTRRSDQNISWTWIELNPTPPPGIYGHAECTWPNASIWISTVLPQAGRYQVAQHEMLHLLGAEHGGRYDSVGDGLQPSRMTTKVDKATYRSSIDVDLDSVALLNWLFEPTAQRQLHANMGFEENTRFWQQNGTSFKWHNSGGHNSLSYMGSVSNTLNNQIWQRIRIITGDDDQQYRAAVSARSLNSSWKTYAQARLTAQSVTFPVLANPYSPDDYVDGMHTRDLNREYSATGAQKGLLVTISDTGPTVVGTTWTPLVGDWYNPATYNGFEMTIYGMTSATDSNGAAVEAGLDNLMGEGT